MPGVTNETGWEPTDGEEGADTGVEDLTDSGGQSSPTTEVTRITDSPGSSDVDVRLLDLIEEELDDVERTLAGLDEDGG